MMRRKAKAIAVSGIALLSIIGASRAADIPGMARPYAAPTPVFAPYSWTGPYVGANLGYQWGDVTHSTANPAGGIFGLQAGYNWQSGQLVVGAETDLQWSNAEDNASGKNFSNSWFGTTRGRVGYAMNNVLLYGTGGLAYGDLELITGGHSQSRTPFGWTLGAGAEVGLTPNWTAKVEYLFINLAEKNYSTGSRHGFDSNAMRAGVNYRF
jgi:outer membrane immunogenic protein